MASPIHILYWNLHQKIYGYKMTIVETLLALILVLFLHLSYQVSKIISKLDKPTEPGLPQKTLEQINKTEKVGKQLLVTVERAKAKLENYEAETRLTVKTKESQEDESLEKLRGLRRKQNDTERKD